jgi:hypothetical protein
MERLAQKGLHYLEVAGTRKMGSIYIYKKKVVTQTGTAAWRGAKRASSKDERQLFKKARELKGKF